MSRKNTCFTLDSFVEYDKESSIWCITQRRGKEAPEEFRWALAREGYERHRQVIVLVEITLTKSIIG